MNIETKYHDPILSYLQANGRQGVNNIAKGVQLPVSSVDKFLKRQTYFKKTTDAKWDLPENVAEERSNQLETSRMGMLVQTLTAQSLIAEQSLDAFTSSINDLLTNIQTISPLLENFKPPVAKSDKATEVHPLFVKMDNNVKEYHKLLNKHMKNIPEQYVDMVKNADIVRLILERGNTFVDERILSEIGMLMMQQSEMLSDDVVDTLMEYQIRTDTD